MRLGISIVATLVCLAAVGPAAAATPVDGTADATPATTAIAPQSSLIASGGGSTSPGGTVSITYTLENTGNSKASAGRLELDPASGLTPVSASGDGAASLSGDPPTVFYGLSGDIAPGERLTTTVTYQVDSNADLGDLQVIGTGYVGSDVDTVQSTVSVVDSDRADLSGPASASAAPGEQVTVSYDLTNNASVAAYGGRLEIRTPTGVSVVDAGGDGNAALGGTPPAVFYGLAGPIPAGDTRTTTVTFAVADDAQGEEFVVFVTGYVEDSQRTVQTAIDASADADPLARFDTNGEAGIQGDEVQAAIISFNANGEIGGEPVTGQEVQRIIIRFNSN